MTPDDAPGTSRAERVQWLREQLSTNPDYDWIAGLAATQRAERAAIGANAPRNGAVWTRAEDDQLRDALANGTPLEEVAVRLRRSTKSTTRRAHHLQTPADEPATSPSVSATTPPADASATESSKSAAARRAHGQPWTTGEVAALLEELRQGLSVAVIARAHQRSVRAIHGRAANILTELTGRAHTLTDDSAVLLRKHMIGTAEPSAPRQLNEVGTSEDRAVHDTLRATLGALRISD